MSNRKNAYTEVYTILQDLNEEEYEKIPSEVIDAIYTNMNDEYEYELNGEIELKDQAMLPETKAILFNLFRDYLATPEQKEKIIKMQNEERKKLQVKKQQMYSINVFENKENKKSQEDELKQEQTQMIEYKENIFTKIINKIKGFFGKY